jgi:hypothetical protein
MMNGVASEYVDQRRKGDMAVAAPMRLTTDQTSGFGEIAGGNGTRIGFGPPL